MRTVGGAYAGCQRAVAASYLGGLAVRAGGVKGAGAEAEAGIRGQGVGIGDSGASRRTYKEVLTAAVNRPNTRSVTRATARAAGGLD